MARRPDIFNQDALKQWLREYGCPESNLSPVLSELKLVVALLLRDTPSEEMQNAFHVFIQSANLAGVEGVASYGIKAIKQWSNEQLESYLQERHQ